MRDLLSRLTMDSRRLLYFYHVAKNGSFSRAEAAVQAPQPVISRHIQKLEEELGVQLLDRNGRGVTLTRIGELLYDRTEPILRAMEEAIAEIDLAKRSPGGMIRIAAPATVMTLYMPEAIKRFRRDKPDVELIAIQALTGEVYEKLVSNRVDLGLVQEVLNPSRFEAHPLLAEPMVCAVSKDHALASKRSISRKKLADFDMVLPSHTHGLRELIDKYFAEDDLRAVTPLQVDSVPLIREIVAGGEQVTILPQSTCMLEFDAERFSFVTLVPAFTRSLYVAHARDLASNSECLLFRKHLQDVVNEKLVEAHAAP
jgi:DNA-binding transcriptional LysR family regulator